MSCKIELTDEEMAELETLLDEGLKNAHEELRRTENFKYREILRHNLDVMEHVARMLKIAEQTAQAV